MKKRSLLHIRFKNNTDCHICSESIKEIERKISTGENVSICLTVEHGERHIHLLSKANIKQLTARYNLSFTP